MRGLARWWRDKQECKGSTQESLRLAAVAHQPRVMEGTQVFCGVETR